MKNILVSSCLLGVNCKYSGGNNLNVELVEFLKYHNIIPICPEVDGGLLTPREPSEIIDGKVINRLGIDVTEQYLLGAKIALNKAKNNHCKVAILKKNSPSCGFGKIYDGTFTSKLIDGNGISADLLYKNGIVILNEDNFRNIN